MLKYNKICINVKGFWIRYFMYPLHVWHSLNSADKYPACATIPAHKCYYDFIIHPSDKQKACTFLMGQYLQSFPLFLLLFPPLLQHPLCSPPPGRLAPRHADGHPRQQEAFQRRRTLSALQVRLQQYHCVDPEASEWAGYSGDWLLSWGQRASAGATDLQLPKPQ